MHRGHPGADEAVTAAERRLGLPAADPLDRGHPDQGFYGPRICDYPEREAPSGGGAAVVACHHCRIGALGSIVNGSTLRDYVRVRDVLAEHLGVAEGALMDPIVAFRAACELADDVAVLRALDRWEAERA